jgi:hypothetical protein
VNVSESSEINTEHTRGVVSTDRTSFGKLQVTGPNRRTRHKWEDNIKTLSWGNVAYCIVFYLL